MCFPMLTNKLTPRVPRIQSQVASRSCFSAVSCWYPPCSRHFSPLCSRKPESLNSIFFQTVSAPRMTSPRVLPLSEKTSAIVTFGSCTQPRNGRITDVLTKVASLVRRREKARSSCVHSFERGATHYIISRPRRIYNRETSSGCSQNG